MSSPSSMIYTMGTALNHARDNQVPVALLVESHWIGGHVVATDGHGVILDSGGQDHCVVRVESVSAVRVMTAAPVPSTTSRAGRNVSDRSDAPSIRPASCLPKTSAKCEL